MGTGWQRTSCGPPSNKVNRTNNLWDTIIKGQQRLKKITQKMVIQFNKHLEVQQKWAAFVFDSLILQKYHSGWFSKKATADQKASLCLNLFSPQRNMF